MSGQAPLFTQAYIDRLRRLTDQYGICTAAEIAKTSPNAIRRVRKRGWTVAHRAPPVRPIPSDFVIQADAMPLHQLAQHYGAGISTVSKWARQIGRARMKADPPKKIHPPRCYLDVLKKHGPTKTARLLNVSPDTERRWRREAGLTTRGESIAVPDQSIGWADRFTGRLAA